MRLQLVDIELANSLAKLQNMAVGQNSNDKVGKSIRHRCIDLADEFY
jgi:hypothetical protein